MLFVCRTEVENHVLFIIENIWRLVIMARRIDMDIKILMAKMLFMIFDMHATLSEDKYESVLTTLSQSLAEVVYGYVTSVGNTQPFGEKEINKQFQEVIQKAVLEMGNRLNASGIQTVWKQKEAVLTYELQNLDWENMKIDECRDTIKRIFTEQSAFDVKEYSKKEYLAGAEQFFKDWIRQLGGQPQASTEILVKSVLDIYMRIEELTGKNQEKQPRQLISRETKRPKSSFHKESRKGELDQLIQILRQNEKIGLLNGIGGIGKTEICKYLFHSCYVEGVIEGIEYIGWLTYRGNLVQTFYEQVLCEKDQESPERAYYDTLGYLQSLGDKLLLFVDNVDNLMAEDPKLKQLFDLNCKLVITSRIQFDSLKSINIGALDEKWAKELFYIFYLGEKNEDCFHEIYNLAKGHPLSIELIAKTAQSSRFNLEEMVQQLRSMGFELPEMKENVIYEEYNKILIEHLNRIFSLSKLSNTYKQILYRLSLLPIEPISVDELIQWKVGKTQEEFEILFHRGWIYLECDGVVMHPAISDAIHSKSSKRYTIYQNMYVAMRNELELSGSTRAHEKYMRMLTFYHVVKRREFKRQEYAELLNQIAVILKNMGEREEAIRLQEKTIKIKKQCGCGKSTLFTGYNNLALAYGRADLRKNLIYCEKAEKIGRELFKEDPEEYALKFATTLNNLSLSYLNNGDLEKAEATQNESISIKTEYRGEDCIELAQSYNNMAIVKKRQNEYDEAYRYQKKSIAIKDAPDYATHLYNMAGMENARGNNEQAVYYIEMAIELWEVDSEFYYYKLMEAYERDLQLLNRDTLTNSVKIQQVVRKIQQLQREKSK